MNLVTIPHGLFARLLRELHRQPDAIACPVGVSRSDDRYELLVRPPSAEPGPHLIVRLNDDLAVPDRRSPDSVGWLTIVRTRRRGQAAGGRFGPDGDRPLDALRLAGPGMHTLPLSPRPVPAPPPVPERWSRTAGALGPAAWHRLTGLSYAIVGAGRSGSAVADLLTGLGGSRVVLIDRDRLEEGNLGEMAAVADADTGRLKAEALAARLPVGRPGQAAIEPLPQSITHVRALRAVQGCDALILCVDQDFARAAAAGLAVLFLKPLVDVGVGVHGRGPGRQMGTDVRLLQPGESCLLCFGGLAK